MLYGCLADPSKTVYCGQLQIPLRGTLDLAIMRNAWQSVVERHDILRTAFDWELKSEPLQIVLARVETDVDFLDLTMMSDEEREIQLAAFLADDLGHGFNLHQPPLMRLAIARLGVDHHTLIWTRHHLTCDGWSLAVMFSELFTIYAALRDRRVIDLPVARPFANYVQWWQTRDQQALQRFWADRLSAFEFAGTQAPASEVSFRETVRILDRPVMESIRAACRTHRITVNTMSQGAWALVLNRHRGIDDVVFGATEAIRPDEEEGICLGPKINTLPVRIQIDPQARIGDWLRGIQASAAAGRQHGRAALSEIASACGLREGRALFDSVLVFQNYPLDGASAPESAGLCLGPTQDASTPDLPLTLVVEPATELTCRLIHERERFSDAAADDLLESFMGALLALANAGTVPVRLLDIRPDLLPALEATDAAPGGTVLHRIAAVPPEDCAIIAGSARITFGALVQRAHAIGRAIETRFGRGQHIGLACAHSSDSIAALLGIQWTGGAYVPLDPRLPPSRLAAMAADATLATIIVDPAVDAATEMTSVPPLIGLAELEAGSEQGNAPDLPTPDALAYIIFTSGSTGRPKGVAVTHRNLIASVAARPAIYPEQVERALLTFPLIFDGSVLGLFSTLAQGGTIVLPDPAPVPDPVALCRLIARLGVTHTVMVPSLHAALLDAAAPGQLSSLIACGVAGEVCEPRLVAQHFAMLPGTALVNEYGPTEATVWASAYRCQPKDANGPVPIGKAVPGTRLYLLDRHLRPVPIETTGEIYIGGTGVAAGYVGNASMTAERFLPDPWSGQPGARQTGARMYRTGDLAVARPDGVLTFQGRADQQIKLRGYRIEPGEIEAALLSAPCVAEAVVSLRSDDGTDRLVAYVVPRPGDAAESSALRAMLAARLPNYMVPHVVVLPDLPRLPSGKLDRGSLPAVAQDITVTGDTPVGADEIALVELWGKVLGHTAIPVNEDFFALGGTSLLGMRLVAQIRTRLAPQMELHHLLRHPTVRELALIVRDCRTEAAAPVAIARRARQRGSVVEPRNG